MGFVIEVPFLLIFIHNPIYFNKGESLLQALWILGKTLMGVHANENFAFRTIIVSTFKYLGKG